MQESAVPYDAIGAAVAQPAAARAALANGRFAVGRRFTIALTLGFGLAALVLSKHPYYGIWHDAYNYALQALRRLYPESLGGDLFFRHGSQDSFTLFSPVYALLIQWLGLDTAAHLVSRVSLLAICGSAWLLARRLLDRDLAWLALALFIAVPGYYGAHDIFRYAEDFATPRACAEALVLLALALLLDGRRVAACAAAGVGLLLHPLVALPGLLFGIWLEASPRARRLLAASGMLLAALAVGMAAIAPTEHLRFVDPVWRAALQDGVPYLLTDQWYFVDWQRCAVTLVTPACAMLALPAGVQRRCAAAALLLGCTGMALAIFASSVAPVALFLQGQPWRWLWVTRAVAVLLFAPLAMALWRRGAASRGVLVLLMLAWIGSEDVLGLPAALLALLALLLDAHPKNAPRAAVWVAWVPVLPLALGMLQVISLAYLVIPAAAIALGWWAAFRARHFLPRSLAILAACLAFALQVEATAARTPPWTFAGETERAFAPWRARIRPDQTVFFPRGWQMAALTLHRRSYKLVSEGVFSRDTALASQDRGERLKIYPTDIAGWVLGGEYGARPALTLPILRRLCRTPEIDFVVAPEPLPVPHLTSYAPYPFDGLNLYACSAATPAGVR
jgi:hypothetical protein